MRSGESSFFDAEQLRFKQSLGDASARNRYKWMTLSLTALMNHARQAGFSHARFAENEKSRVDLGHLFRRIVDGLHARIERAAQQMKVSRRSAVSQDGMDLVMIGAVGPLLFLDEVDNVFNGMKAGLLAVEDAILASGDPAVTKELLKRLFNHRPLPSASCIEASFATCPVTALLA